MSDANLMSSAMPADAYSVPLEQIDVSQPALFQNDLHWDYFARLRAEKPVHYCEHSLFGPYWSVTRFNDIMSMEKDYAAFSSAAGIILPDRPEDFALTNFIGMDPPRHDAQRKTVQGVVAPMNLAKLEGTIRSRAQHILDRLPVGESFNWVDLVSVELTTQMLATIFDFPFEERNKLTYWSDMATSGELGGGPTPEAERRAALLECLEYFTDLRKIRANEPAKPDLLSMLAHGKDTQDMEPFEFLGNLVLLIVGGNDTTRNSISGGVLALNENPEEYAKLRADLTLIPNMVSEIIRWQTPLAYMRRTATKDIEFGGETIRQGDKLAMWYVSGNRDDEVIPDPNRFWIDRPNARHHLSFGFGLHRCMGNRLAEMQLRVLWEEIMQRFRMVEVVGEAERVQSSFVRGYSSLPVQVHPW
ncbi:MAG: cytochrome P450 [SAR116 cluster bacterium]|nr:MAG: cytochrome P450 [SAR116 cluster bacterium]HCD26244.1 cytochrome P450 [Gammaproteobacteria bacterium]|tara:strand:+ start:3362 stop:4609 length:1248 start_codon:yes stop_codon:yes gene_type:complete